MYIHKFFYVNFIFSSGSFIFAVKVNTFYLNMEFQLTKAKAEEASLLTSLIREVWNGMEQQEWFAPEEGENYIRQLIEQEKGVAWIATDTASEKIAGLFLIVYPRKDNPDNLGRDISLPEHELNLVAHMDTVVVPPSFRGYGLQRKLTAKAEEELRAAGYRYLLCTAHPDNCFSRINMEKAGYRCVKQVLKYGGLPRLILMKEV